MHCPQCQHQNGDAAKFCEECGMKLITVCPQCGHQTSPTAKFCAECGTPLSGKSEIKQSSLPPQAPIPNTQLPSAERRQLTVLFCDLVGSTALSTQLDPEDLRAIVQQYQQTCAAVIQRHDGYIAQYLGDGLLVYFGYPTAHEDDARRAVRAGLEILSALQPIASRPQLPSPFEGEGQGEGDSSVECKLPSGERKSPLPALSIPHSAFAIPHLPVRIGIHSGLVVIGDIGGSGRTEQLALGETPNIAARIQGLAEPNTVIISAATQRLIDDQFESQPFGSHLLKGIATPIAVYHVQSERQSVSPLAGRTTLTPLIGREQEVGLLIDRWEQTKEGRGQVVLLSGEPGIGKSRLAYTLREHVTSEGSLLFEARCSPYHQHSAFYPLIDVLQRTLLLNRQDSDREKMEKLERALALYNLQESLPLFAALLSLPAPSAALLALTPQKQKERTLQALLQLMVAQAERQATVSVWEDLHWADPSSLEFLSLLIEQIPTTNLLLVLTFRPEFTPRWKPRSHLSQLVLNRLGKKHVETMIEQVAGSKGLSGEMIEQIRMKTDGVPLFVEELTKSVVESVGDQGPGVGGRERKAGTELAIPATLQEALLARLDRLSSARQVAQLGATLGREFSHELIQAVTPLSEADLHTALDKLVEAEILYQRGIGEQARYFFKHALIQDTAYQSLLKSTRLQYHQQIVQVLEEHFPDIKNNQPELLAHHYTEAHLIEQAIPYWQQAGQKAVTRSANAEAINHLNKGLELLKSQPDTPEHAQQELILQITLGVPMMASKGLAAPEVQQAYTRARELCQQVGETPQIFPLLLGLRMFYMARAEHKIGYEITKQCLALAQNAQNLDFLLEAYCASGAQLIHLGDFIQARTHLEQSIALYDPGQHRSHAFLYGQDPKVSCLVLMAYLLWCLGYPDQALRKGQEALTLAHEVAHPFSLGIALWFVAILSQHRREIQTTKEQAEATVALATDQGFPNWVAIGTLLRGWALTMQGQGTEGITQMRQGLVAHRTTGAEVSQPYYLGLLAEAYAREGQEEGLRILSEAFALVNKTGECYYEAELYRLKGELLLAQASKEQRARSTVQKSEDPDSNSHILDPRGEAEACFRKAIAIARQQQAKSWELRASTNLARLWQSQGKKAEAHKLLSEVYNWFTEGFDTKDLQEAKSLLEELRP